MAASCIHHNLLLLFFFFLCCNSAIGLTREQELDRISVLPGQPPVAFAQFSGYVTVNEEHGSALFYWLTEAASNPSTKPLVLWLNGGPGCSSVAFGASEEIGPFRINKTASSLYLNKYSWNRVVRFGLAKANILFLESPVGVGFSYSNSTSYLNNSDTAEDSLTFLITWMSRFPQYKYREFYLTGESYAGNYVPQLAKKILDYNKAHSSKAHSSSIINLKGFMVGNALMDKYYDQLGRYTYWWTHSMISDQTYSSILDKCDFVNELSKECFDLLGYAASHEIGEIDFYSIYSPYCLEKLGNGTRSTRSEFLEVKNTNLPMMVSGYDPCSESYAEMYYNRDDVQKAMHANVTGIPYKWTACSEVVGEHWNDSDDSMLSTYKELIAAGLKIWVFSGDTDEVLPVTSTRLSLNHMNLTVKTRWYPWKSGAQVGGWTEEYEGLTFATVRGAGHEVPLHQPRRAFTLFRSFLAGKQLPSS
ncbi:Serine carboxypeptidase 24 [Linum perenne]